jgi:hypothetical protein
MNIQLMLQLCKHTLGIEIGELVGHKIKTLSTQVSKEVQIPHLPQSFPLNSALIFT